MLRFDRQENALDPEVLLQSAGKKPLIGAQPPDIAWRYSRNDNRPYLLDSHSNNRANAMETETMVR